VHLLLPFQVLLQLVYFLIKLLHLLVAFLLTLHVWPEGCNFFFFLPQLETGVVLGGRLVGHLCADDRLTDLQIPCLPWQQSKVLLHEDKGAKLGEVVSEDKMVVFEPNRRVTTRHCDVIYHYVLVIASS